MNDDEVVDLMKMWTKAMCKQEPASIGGWAEASLRLQGNVDANDARYWDLIKQIGRVLYHATDPANEASVVTIGELAFALSVEARRVIDEDRRIQNLHTEVAVRTMRDLGVPEAWMAIEDRTMKAILALEDPDFRKRRRESLLAEAAEQPREELKGKDQ